jgi:ketosteroid isomerase-like protein
VELVVAATLVFRLATDGRITRLEEYLDTRANDPLTAVARARR